MAGKAKQNEMGGGEMGKQPMCWGGGPKVYHFYVECSYLLRGTYTDFGGMAFIPFKAAEQK